MIKLQRLEPLGSTTSVRDKNLEQLVRDLGDMYNTDYGAAKLISVCALFDGGYMTTWEVGLP